MCIMISIPCVVLGLVLLSLGPIHSVVISHLWNRKKTEEGFAKTSTVISVCTLALYGIIIGSLIIYPFLHTCPHCPYDGDIAHTEGCLCEVCEPHDEGCSCDNCFLEYYYKSVHHGRTCTCDDCTRYYELRGGN